MLITKKISNFLVFETESILRSLEKINDNQNRIVFVVSEEGVLSGSLTDGDFRRWITSTADFNLSQDVQNIMNTGVTSRKLDAERSEIETAFSPAISIIPLTDDYNRLVAIALGTEKGISIGNHVISETSPSFIIAELGNNHNGDIDLAKGLVDLAQDAGADCVKFQMRDLASLYKGGKEKDQSADLGTQYTLDILNKFQLSTPEMIEVFDYCKSKSLTPLCTPWDIRSLEILEDYGMEAYKVASADFTNHELLGALAATGKPLICSTGMSSEIEIKASVDFLIQKGAEFILLHCNSTYPTPFKDINLKYLKRLKRLTPGVVGYSGHERGISVPVSAVTLGAKVIEKHFTIDKSMEGNDHKVSLLPQEFADMVSMIREVEDAFGNSDERELTQGELINRENLAKSLIINRNIGVNEVITRDMVDVKSPGQGLQPMYLEQLVGRIAKRDFVAGDYFYESDIKQDVIAAREYKFRRPFGVPVRYHDYKKLTKKTNADFVEFHLSYQDMELNIDDLLDQTHEFGFAVHCPELFADDHILDLTSSDAEYRAKSISELQRVCDITRELKKRFPQTKCPAIVVNAGGFSSTGFIDRSKRAALYQKIAAALNEINRDGVEIAIQTMPPFPWHFGGQSYHNIFVDPDEIDAFCRANNTKICYDISHSMMACNYYKWDIMEFTKTIAPHIVHMHVVDAKGIDGEGVQIGQGDVDFQEMASLLSEVTPNIQFIPEVWQGHKNSGEGFWDALNFLEQFGL